MRLAVVGSRNFRNEELVVWTLDLIEYLCGPFQLVSGGAIGPDSIAEEWYRDRLYADPDLDSPLIFEPDWNRLGRAAGPARNSTIVSTANAVVAFWDGYSSGTYDTIRKSHLMNRPILVVYPDGRMELE